MSNFDPLLKEFTEGLVRDQINQEVELKKWLSESTQQWAGRHIRFPVKLGRNTGVGARAESGTLPGAGNQRSAEAQVTSAYIYGRIDLTGQVMASDKNAFATSMMYEMEGVTNDLVFDCARQSYGEGHGILAQIQSDSCATSITVINQYAEPGQPGARFIEQGTQLDVGSLADPDAASGGYTATSVNVVSVSIAANSGTTTDTVTISASLDTVTASSFLYNYDAGGSGLELKGLRAIVCDSTTAHVYGYSGGMLGEVVFQNIDANSESRWRGNVDYNSGTVRLIDSHLMQKSYSKVKRASGKQVNFAIGEYDAVDAFLDSVSGDRRYATKTFDAGHEALSFNGNPLVRDLLAPYNEMFLLNRDSLKWAVLKDFGFADEDGRIFKNVTGTDRFEAFIKAYLQISCEQRNANAVIRDIKTTQL